MNETLLLIIYLVMIIIMAFTYSKYHVINNLIILEFIASMLIFSLLVMTKMLMSENFIAIMVTVLMIMESVMGLSLLINLIRTHSNDYLKSISVIKF